MAKVVTDNTHYTQIANEIRYYCGNQDTYKPSQLPKAVSDACSMMYRNGKIDGYGQGYAEGTQAEKENSLGSYYAGSFLGDDTRAFSIEIPFYPDMIFVHTTNAMASAVANTYTSMSMDLRSADRYLGIIMFCSSNGSAFNTRVPTASREDVFSYDNGVFTFRPLEGQLPGVLWRSGVRYFITAARYAQKGTYVLLTEQISKLPDAVPAGCSGELFFHKATVEQVMSLQEWAGITSQKPNWTFTLI